MRPDEFERTLEAVHARPARGVLPGRAELEGELLARHETLYSRGRGFMMTTLLKRPVLALLLIAVLGIAACTVPTETQVELGHRFVYATEDGAALTAAVPELNAYLEALPGMESVSVGIREIEGGESTLELILFGSDLDPARLESSLRRQWPVLDGARVESEVLEGTVRTSLAEKLGHDLFHFDFEVEGTPEEMRAQILEQIRASGFDGDADVQVSTDGDVTTFEIEMTDDGTAPDGRAIETEDEIVIELKRDTDGS